MFSKRIIGGSCLILIVFVYRLLNIRCVFYDVMIFDIALCLFSLSIQYFFVYIYLNINDKNKLVWLLNLPHVFLSIYSEIFFDVIKIQKVNSPLLINLFFYYIFNEYSNKKSYFMPKAYNSFRNFTMFIRSLIN